MQITLEGAWEFSAFHVIIEFIFHLYLPLKPRQLLVNHMWLQLLGHTCISILGVALYKMSYN